MGHGRRKIKGKEEYVDIGNYTDIEIEIERETHHRLCKRERERDTVTYTCRVEFCTK
jgi:hypothetical protein